jgi:hypothetical protein
MVQIHAMGECAHTHTDYARIAPRMDEPHTTQNGHTRTNTYTHIYTHMHAYIQQIRIQENKLEKATMKVNEASAFRKTYDHIISRLKDEKR